MKFQTLDLSDCQSEVALQTFWLDDREFNLSPSNGMLRDWLEGISVLECERIGDMEPFLGRVAEIVSGQKGQIHFPSSVGKRKTAADCSGAKNELTAFLQAKIQTQLEF